MIFGPTAVSAATIFLILYALNSQALAADMDSSREILVKAPRLMEESIEASGSVSIIDDQEIRLKKPETVADLLSDLPGVEVVRQGGVGQTASVFIRGARSEDTLVLIDGIEANDAMSPSSGYDFSSLSAENIERIEVYRGPQSVRFGAGALGGVINIITKVGTGPTQGHYFVEAGTYNTARAALGILGSSDSLAYSVAADTLQTQGFSAAAAKNGNTESDGAKVGSASAKLAWSPDAISKLTATLRYTQAHIDLDQHGGTGGDDPNDTGQSAQLLVGVEGHRRFWSDQLKSSFGIYYSEVRRSDSNLPDANSSDSSADSFLSENQKIESNHELSIGDHHVLRLSLQWQQETGSSNSVFDSVQTLFPREQQSILGEALTYIYETPTWFGDIGGRADQQSRVGSIPSVRASLGRFFPATETRLSLTYGSGFKVPSLYQLYSSYGNQDLQRESSGTTELTLEQKISDRATASIAYFQNTYHHMIDFDVTTSKYLNISNATSQGVELQASFQISSDLNLEANGTYLDTKDESTGLSLLRRPAQAGNLVARFHRGPLEGFAQLHGESERADLDPITFTRINDSAYAIANAGGTYQLNPKFKISVRIENLLGTHYEQVAGYGTAGRSAYVGLTGDL